MKNKKKCLKTMTMCQKSEMRAKCLLFISSLRSDFLFILTADFCQTTQTQLYCQLIWQHNGLHMSLSQYIIQWYDNNHIFYRFISSHFFKQCKCCWKFIQFLLNEQYTKNTIILREREKNIDCILLRSKLPTIRRIEKCFASIFILCHWCDGVAYKWSNRWFIWISNDMLSITRFHSAS